jgi:hypothetical protein
MSTPRPPPNNSEKKNKIDAFAFFSIGRKKGTTKNDKVLVSDSDSEAEVKSRVYRGVVYTRARRPPAVS